MKQAEPNKQIQQEQNQLTTEWYNQNEQLYRTYLQSLYLRVRDISQDKYGLSSLINKYLKAEEMLLQIGKPQQTKLQVEQTYEKNIESSNQQIDANQKQIFALQKDIDTKEQQKRLLTQLLKTKVENYSKVLASYSHTINQKQDSSDRQNREISFDVPNIEDNITQTTINKLLDKVSNSFKQAEEYKLQGGLIRLQAEKQKLVNEICQVIDKQALPQQLQQLYRQKVQTLKQIKQTQQEITKYNNEIQTKQRSYDQAALQNKNLHEQISRLRLRTVDELLMMDDLDEDGFRLLEQNEEVVGQLYKQNDKKSNKRIAFTQQSPQKTRLMLLCWAVVVAIFWLIAVLV